MIFAFIILTIAAIIIFGTLLFLKAPELLAMIIVVCAIGFVIGLALLMIYGPIAAFVIYELHH